jgi:uncharacterized protein involved in exopolysaccharide biosynthesis
MESASPRESGRIGRDMALTWWSILLLSLGGGLLVGAIVFVCFPLRYTASASVLSGEEGSKSALMEMAQSAVPGLAGNGGGLSVIRMEAVLRSVRIRKVVAGTTRLAERLGVPEEQSLRHLAGMTNTRKSLGGVLAIEVTVTGPSRWGQWLGHGGTAATVDTKKLAAEVANGYVEALRAYLGEADQENIRFITASRDDVARQLEQIEDQLEVFRVQYGIADPQRSLDRLGDVAKRSQEAYATALADQAGISSSLQAARSHLGSQTATRLEQVIASRNPVISALTQKLADAKVELNAARAGGKTDTHPDVLELQDTVSATEAELKGVVQEVQTQVTRGANPAYDSVVSKVIALEISQADAQARSARYRSDFEDVSGHLAGLPPVMRRYGELELQRQLKAEVLVNIAKRLEAARLEEKRKSADKFQVLDEALPPTTKSGPSAPRSAAMATVLLGLVLSLFALRRSGLLAAIGTEQA